MNQVLKLPFTMINKYKAKVPQRNWRMHIFFNEEVLCREQSEWKPINIWSIFIISGMYKESGAVVQIEV